MPPCARSTLRRSAFDGRLAAIAALLLMLGFAKPAMALISVTVAITADVTGGASNCSGGSNGFNYDYTVDNEATAFPMVDFEIPLSNSGDVCNIEAPSGWDSSFNGNTLIFQAASSEFDLSPDGGQLVGFELDSSLPGIQEQFTADLLNSQGYLLSVPVDPPAPLQVPEPSTETLIAWGAIGAALFLRRRRVAV